MDNPVEIKEGLIGADKDTSIHVWSALKRFTLPPVKPRFNEIFYAPNNYVQAEVSGVLPKDYKTKITSNESIKCRTVTSLCISKDSTKIFLGFQKGFFETFNSMTLELLPKFEPPADPKPTNPISRIVNYAYNGVFVVVRNTITEYLCHQLNYEFKYFTKNNVREIIKVKGKYYAVDARGLFYSFLDAAPAIGGNGQSRNIFVEPVYEIGLHTEVFKLESSEDDELLLVRHNQNLGIMDLRGFPGDGMTLCALRCGLTGVPDRQIQFRCSGNLYFFAILPRYLKTDRDIQQVSKNVADRSVYFNSLASIGSEEGQDNGGDDRFEAISGQLKDFNVSNEFLYIITTNDHIEIFDLKQLERIFDIEIYYVPREVIIFRDSIIILTKQGHMLSRPLVPKENNCCYHCEHLFKPGPHNRICKHFIPRHPLTTDELAEQAIQFRFG